MMKTYESIQLFKKKLGTDDTTQQLLTKEDLPDSEQQLPPTNPVESLPRPGIAKVIQNVLEIHGIDLKDKYSLDSLRDRDVVWKRSLWSIFRKNQ